MSVKSTETWVVVLLYDSITDRALWVSPSVSRRLQDSALYYVEIQPTDKNYEAVKRLAPPVPEGHVAQGEINTGKFGPDNSE